MAFQTLIHVMSSMKSLHLEPLTVAVVVLLLPVWSVGGAFLFEDLATAKHGVSLLCRDDGGGGGER